MGERDFADGSPNDGINYVRTRFASSERPILLWTFCALGFLGLPFVILGLVLPSSRDIMIDSLGTVYVALTILFAISGITGLIGLWRMRRWGLWTYSLMGAASISLGIVSGTFSISGYLALVVVIAGGLIHFKKLR